MITDVHVQDVQEIKDLFLSLNGTWNAEELDQLFLCVYSYDTLGLVLALLRFEQRMYFAATQPSSAMLEELPFLDFLHELSSSPSQFMQMRIKERFLPAFAFLRETPSRLEKLVPVLSVMYEKGFRDYTGKFVPPKDDYHDRFLAQLSFYREVLSASFG